MIILQKLIEKRIKDHFATENAVITYNKRTVEDYLSNESTTPYTNTYTYWNGQPLEEGVDREHIPITDCYEALLNNFHVDESLVKRCGLANTLLIFWRIPPEVIQSPENENLYGIRMRLGIFVV